MDQELFSQGYRDFPQINPLRATAQPEDPYRVGFETAARIALLDAEREALIQTAKLASGGAVGNRVGFL